MKQPIRVVLARAENPANIGQVARAMKNFGFPHLILVDSASHQTEEAYTLGWKAKDILNKAQVCPALGKAVKHASLVVGFTRRSGRRRGQGRHLADITPQILEAAKSGAVYLVFGNEKNGLSNDELKHCHELVTIPTTRAYPALNLSHAVALALYSIFSGTKKGQKVNKKPDEFYATPAEFELLMRDFREVLTLLRYHESPKKNLLEGTLFNIRNFFKKNGVEKREFHLFRAFLSRVLERPNLSSKKK